MILCMNLIKYDAYTFEILNLFLLLDFNLNKSSYILKVIHFKLNKYKHKREIN